MSLSLVEKQINCPCCGEYVSVLLDLSAGGQIYIEDCQVCCRPMEISYSMGELGELDIRVCNAG